MKTHTHLQQNPTHVIHVKDGIRYVRIGRGNQELKEKAEKVIGNCKFFKIKNGGQVVKNLNGGSPYMNYYLTEEDVKAMGLYETSDSSDVGQVA